MHDFKELFKEQLAQELPWTEKTVRASVQGHSYHLNARQLMEKSKELKTKVGLKRLRYYLVQPGNADPKMISFWDNEFDQLQEKLADHVFMGHDGQIPKFAPIHEEEKQ